MTLRSIGCIAALALGLAAGASAEEAPAWDGERASALADQLVPATHELFDAFFKQPRPPSTPRSLRDYDRLERDIRRLRNQAQALAAALRRGEGREETKASFESLLVTARWARERARSVFTTQDVEERARAVGALLEQLAPLYGTRAPAAD